MRGEALGGEGNTATIAATLLPHPHPTITPPSPPSGTAPDPSFDGAVTDNGDGTYSVTYYTTRSGTYDLMIKLRETPSPPHHLDDPTQTYDAEALETGE